MIYCWFSMFVQKRIMIFMQQYTFWYKYISTCLSRLPRIWTLQIDIYVTTLIHFNITCNFERKIQIFVYSALLFSCSLYGFWNFKISFFLENRKFWLWPKYIPRKVSPRKSPWSTILYILTDSTWLKALILWTKVILWFYHI